MAIKVCELELSQDIMPIWGTEGYDALHVLVRYRGHPVGWVRLSDLPRSVVSAERLRETITEQLAWDMLPIVLGEQDHDEHDEMADDASFAPISVIVCTRDRTDQLRGCLDALLALDYPRCEIIVVDNAPRNDDTAQLARRMPIRYIREDHPGLDWARNRGIAEARYSIVAFTDDDARPDRYWLRAIAIAFADPTVDVVTGFVAPIELESKAQITFETLYGGMGHGFRRRVIHRTTRTTARDLLWASNFGVGANMAFRHNLFAAIGPFDVALDVGTPSRGGGDIEMLHRVVTGAHMIVYEPAALVWHTHRRDFASLRRQLYDNGHGFGAYLLTCARNRSVGRGAILRFALYNWIWKWLLRRLLRPHGFPRHLVASELLGALLSPFAYNAAQEHVAKASDGKISGLKADVSGRGRVQR